MLRSSLVVTAGSVFGLAVGFVREILIVRTWGAGATADSILVAVFIPEAFRMLLAGGVLVSAALPLWLACEDRATRKAWSATLSLFTLGAVTILVATLLLLDDACIWIIGPGLEQYARESALTLFHIAVFALPGLFLQALLTTQHHAKAAFLWPALGALMFNIPGVSYLLWAGAQATPRGFVISLVIGSLLTALPLLPRAWRNDWRPFGPLQLTFIRDFWSRFWPLLTGGIAAQMFSLLERALASLAGEGSVVLVNLARKLVNLPAIVTFSLSQVIASRAAVKTHEGDQAGTTSLLRQALAGLSIVTWPSTVVILIWAPVVPLLIAPNLAPASANVLVDLLRYYAPALVLGSWSNILARYLFATGKTLAPTKMEITGVVAQAATALVLFPLFGVYALAIGFSAGYALSALLLARRSPLRTSLPWLTIAAIGLAAGTAMLTWVYPVDLARPMWLLVLEILLVFVVMAALTLFTLRHSLWGTNSHARS